MALDIKFQCDACEKYEDNLFKYKPSWASVAGYDNRCVAWIGEGLVTKNKSVIRMTEPPAAGKNYTLEVNHPFRARLLEDCWTLFQPWDSAVNGWEEHPHELEFSRIVKCQPVDVIKKNERSYWVAINVLDSIEFTEISNRFAKGSGPIPLYPKSRMLRLDWKNLIYFHGNLEGDVAAWFICQKQDEQVTMLLYGISEWHKNFFYAGNRPLSVDEFNILEKDFSR